MARHLPNFLTLCNLFCGCCALVFLLKGQFAPVPWFILGCFLFDYTDGMCARALRVNSPLGKELDSLADGVSFGVVPGALFYTMLTQAFHDETLTDRVCTQALPAFVLSAFAALRLGKFNLDTRQTSYFIGLTTPATTVFTLGLFLTSQYNFFGLAPVILHPVLLYILVLVLCFLMLSEIPMYGLKAKPGGGFQKNKLPLFFLLLFGSLFYFLKALALSITIVLYVLYSVFNRRQVMQGE
jgi:CDP-diacylglycerol---serine O-phosphatidyltransferase